MSKNYGDKSNNFNNKGIVSDKALATVLLRVLEYPETEFTWKTAVDVLKAKTGIEIAGDKLTRGEAFEAIWKAVSTPVMFVKDGESPKYLGVEVGKLDIAIITPPVKDLAIDSVSADNLKEIKVNFNQQVNKDKLGTFSLSDNLKLDTTTLLEDGMTVVLTLKGQMTNQKNYKISVKDTEAVEEKAGKLAEVKDLEFTCFDKELPEVKSVEFTGPKHITITFNEPIKDKTGKPEFSFGTGSTVTPNASKTKVVGNKVTYELYSSLKADTEYTITVKDFEDLAGYKNIKHTAKLVFTANTEAPTVSVKSANQESVTLVFSKPVKGLKPEYFSHSFSIWTAKTVDIAESDFTTEAVITFWNGGKDDKALPEGSVKFTVNGKNIKDLWGNVLGVSEFTLSISADKAAPTVEAFKPVENSDNKFNVTFSKEVVLEAKHISAKNNDVAVVGITVKQDTKNKKVWEITLPGVKQGSKVALEIKDAKDKTVNANEMEKFTDAFTVEDTTAPTIAADKVTFNVPANEISTTTPVTMVLWFDEALDSSALNMSNYTLQTVDSGVISNQKFLAEADFVPGNTAVKFTITDKEFKEKLFKTPATPEMNVNLANEMFIEISGVKDIYGNAMKTISLDAKNFKKESTYTAKVKSITITNETTAVVMFENYIKTATKEGFTINNGDGALVAGTDFDVTEIDEKKVTLTLTNNKKFPVDLKTNLAISVMADKVETIEGLKVAAVTYDWDGGAEQQIVEKIAPTVNLVQVGTEDKINLTAAAAKVEIEFSEAIVVVNPALLAQELKLEFTSNGALMTTVGHEHYGMTPGYTITVDGKKLVITTVGTLLDWAGIDDKAKVTFTKDAFKYITDKSKNEVKVPTVLETKEDHN